jgi:TolB protein
MHYHSVWRVIALLVALTLTGCDDPTGPPRWEGVIAFDSFSDDQDLAFYVMPARGGRATRLSLPPNAVGISISWSPDGRQIAYVGRVSNGPRTMFQIFIANADGTGSRQLTTESENDALYPAWSPDGNSIAYLDNGVDAYGINLIATDGSGRTRIANTTRIALGRPTWSPLGTEIAFVGHTGGPETEGLYVIRTDGSNLRPVTINPGASEPQWSPDGTLLAFAEESADGAHTWRIALIRLDGTNQRYLTAPGGLHTGPSWSPDGDAIAYQSSSFGGISSRLFIVDVASGRSTPLTSGASYDERPSWGPVSEP